MDHEAKEERCYINLFARDTIDISFVSIFLFLLFFPPKKIFNFEFIEYTIHHRLIQKRGYIEKKEIFSFFLSFFFFFFFCPTFGSI